MEIDSSNDILMLLMGGTLFQILRRLHGLQILELRLFEGWQDFVPDFPNRLSKNTDWPEQFG